MDFMTSPFMNQFRLEKLQGIKSSACEHCYYEDSHDKLSGRHKQLLKSAITIKDFNKSICASPHYNLFEDSLTNGKTLNSPTDIQIDLGNTCNSACIMCTPSYSSKLATDYKKLIKLSPDVFPVYAPVTNWADNPELLNKFVDELQSIKNLRYLHFIGGETLYLRSFYKICNALIDAGLSKDIMLGITTNLTIYSQELVDLIKHFKEVHLGVSIEALTELNDYIRYPSKISEVKTVLDCFLELREHTNLHVSLRLTPSIFTVYQITDIFKLMIEKNVIVESCNILSTPSCLRMELLPEDLRQRTIEKIENLINSYQLINTAQIINHRRGDLISGVISNRIFEYLQFLKNYTVPDDVELERYKLVKFIKSFEAIRNNSILDHLPDYENFLRSYGY
jgi:sulfatase maturation enzyme AslB (radical SAM superfamily)